MNILIIVIWMQNGKGLFYDWKVVEVKIKEGDLVIFEMNKLYFFFSGMKFIVNQYCDEICIYYG